MFSAIVAMLAVEDAGHRMSAHADPQKAPLYLGDHTVNCWVPQVSTDMYLDTRDRGIVAHLCRGRGWEPSVTRTFVDTVQSNWTVVDVGANFGWYTLHWANKIRSFRGAGKVISIEASPRTYDLLSTSVENAGLLGSPVSIHNVAATDHAGVVAFTSTPDRSLNNHVVEVPGATGGGTAAVAPGTVQVQAVALDAILQQEKRVDFIKIDVEGFEALAWEGLQATLDKNPNCIARLSPVHDRPPWSPCSHAAKSSICSDS